MSDTTTETTVTTTTTVTPSDVIDNVVLFVEQIVGSALNDTAKAKVAIAVKTLDVLADRFEPLVATKINAAVLLPAVNSLLTALLATELAVENLLTAVNTKTVATTTTTPVATASS